MSRKFRQLLDSAFDEYDNLQRMVDRLQRENVDLRRQLSCGVFHNSATEPAPAQSLLPLPKGDTAGIESPRYFGRAVAAGSSASLSKAMPASEAWQAVPVGKPQGQRGQQVEGLPHSTSSSGLVVQHKGEPKDSDHDCANVPEVDNNEPLFLNRGMSDSHDNPMPKLNDKLLSKSCSKVNALDKCLLSDDQKPTELALSAAARRLRTRFGKLNGDDKLINAPILHETIKSLGLVKYSADEVNSLIGLLLRLDGTCEVQVGIKYSIKSSLGISKKRAVPGGCAKENRKKHKLQSSGTYGWLGRLFSNSASLDGPRWNEIPFDDFVERILPGDVVLRANQVDPEISKCLGTIREVLLSGDSNRLVAELTNVRIDDLASPPPHWEALWFLEPVVYIMILVNCLIVGFQANNDNKENWAGWVYIEAAFVTFFVIELTVRIRGTGTSTFFFGKDYQWNWFDTIVVLLAIVDVGMTLLAAVFPQAVSLSFLRLMRIARLTKLIRMFEFQALKELSLMLKGLLGGLRTLVWATLLLIAAMYIIGVLSCWTIGSSQRHHLNQDYPARYFRNVPVAMFTTFRCFLGDCSDEKGVSLTVRLTDAHGLPFMAAYCVSTMLVTFGIFNLIVAIYIENTLEAARNVTEVDKRKRYRESLRVAHCTKSLVKKFATAARACGIHEEDHSVQPAEKTISEALREPHNDADDIGLDEVIISKDMFLLVIQDPSVQSLMDSLGIPPDRAELFDVLDADASGGLHIQEIVMGMLKVRGDTRRSDAVATLLTLRSLQSMFSELADNSATLNKKQDDLLAMLQCSGVAAVPSGVVPKIKTEFYTEVCKKSIAFASQ